MTSIRRIAFLHAGAGPITPEHWSGTPFALVGAFESLGLEVVEVGYRAPKALRSVVHAISLVTTPDPTAAARSRAKLALRRMAQQHSLNSTPNIDAIVAVDTDSYRLDWLRLPAPVATYDDTTFQTMWDHPESDLRGGTFKEASVRGWIRTQKESSRAATVNCVSTSWAKQSFVSDYKIQPERITVVGMGHRPRSVTGLAGRDWRTPKFLFVGIDWRRKNGDAVLRAFRKVRATYPAAELHIVGKHETIIEPGVADHGLLRREDAAAQRSLDNLYASATAFVLPSRFDPSPIAYLEAASAGLPVVATTEGGAGELLGDAALVTSPFDGEAILRAMLTLADPAEAARRGAACQAVASGSTWLNVAKRILAAIESRTS